MHTGQTRWVLVVSFLLACLCYLTASTITLGQDEGKKFGTGFVVSNQGHILTNNHVVAGCRTLSTRDGKPLQVLSKNPRSDLALLQANFAPSAVAVFRTGPAPKLGDEVVAFGFPLSGLLSSDGNVSAGILSATTGIQNDVRFIQISAPVQPGNSGGPLFDSSGHVIGVVVAKLDAVKVAEITGDVPQNVNFAVNLAEVRAFLDDAAVPYQKEISQHAMPTSSIAATATQVSVAIECTQEGIAMAPAPTGTISTAGERVWTSLTAGLDYKIRIDGDYIYARCLNPPTRWQLSGTFLNFEFKKVGEKWVGRRIFKGPYNGVVGGPPIWCQTETDAEINEVTNSRIEGRAMSWSAVNVKTCQPEGAVWKPFTWIPK